MTDLKKAFAKLFWSESQDDVVLTTNEDALFSVSLDKLLIGTLSYSNSKWTFAYSDDFKLQNKIRPLTNFPSVDKTYTSDELWPFFSTRIPSNAQLQQDEHSSNSESIVSLLQRFGSKVIANPYELRLEQQSK